MKWESNRITKNINCNKNKSYEKLYRKSTTSKNKAFYLIRVVNLTVYYNSVIIFWINE